MRICSASEMHHGNSRSNCFCTANQQSSESFKQMELTLFYDCNLSNRICYRVSIAVYSCTIGLLMLAFSQAFLPFPPAPSNAAYPSNNLLATLSNQFANTSTQRLVPVWTSVPGQGIALVSAFFESDAANGSQAIVKLLGLCSAEESHPRKDSLHCRITSRSNPAEFIAPATLLPIKNYFDNWRMAIYSCAVPVDKFDPERSEISLGTRHFASQTWHWSSGLTALPRFPSNQANITWNLAVCVMKRVALKDDPWLRLAAFLEHHIAEGVQHFLIYKESWGPKTEQMLGLYEADGLVTIIEWPGDFSRVQLGKKKGKRSDDPRSVSSFGAQWLVMHDCLFRISSKARLVGMLDVDEFVVRRGGAEGGTLLGALEKAQAEADGEMNAVGSFHLRHSFFVWRRQDPDPEADPSMVLRNVSHHLDVRRGSELSSLIYRPGLRSKYIVRPEAVEALDIHEVLVFRKGFGGLVVGPSAVALLNERRSRAAVRRNEPRQGGGERGDRRDFLPQPRLFGRLQRSFEQRIRQRLAGRM